MNKVALGLSIVALQVTVLVPKVNAEENPSLPKCPKLRGIHD